MSYDNPPQMEHIELVVCIIFRIQTVTKYNGIIKVKKDR